MEEEAKEQQSGNKIRAIGNTILIIISSNRLRSVLSAAPATPTSK